MTAEYEGARVNATDGLADGLDVYMRGGPALSAAVPTSSDPRTVAPPVLPAALAGPPPLEMLMPTAVPAHHALGHLGVTGAVASAALEAMEDPNAIDI